jgi:hypothetical protein
MKMKEGRMLHYNIIATGGYLSREVKVAVGLRNSAGGSYLDVSCLFGIHHEYIHKVFQDVTKICFVWMQCHA